MPPMGWLCAPQAGLAHAHCWWGWLLGQAGLSTSLAPGWVAANLPSRTQLTDNRERGILYETEITTATALVHSVAFPSPSSALAGKVENPFQPALPSFTS